MTAAIANSAIAPNPERAQTLLTQTADVCLQAHPGEGKQKSPARKISEIANLRLAEDAEGRQ